MRGVLEAFWTGRMSNLTTDRVDGERRVVMEFVVLQLQLS